ncbi:hypothetical protein XELAEV_18011755mg [Xenopus laevis]|uniref:Uncharacterized protein n=1 Tax=Xenopus laevis TaxID=8355 RepID=A0A974DN80_XENLA|nr:hypothetical protein XELAEV_18011755mg [Xenopus laevis]
MCATTAQSLIHSLTGARTEVRADPLQSHVYDIACRFMPRFFCTSAATKPPPSIKYVIALQAATVQLLLHTQQCLLYGQARCLVGVYYFCVVYRFQ